MEENRHHYNKKRANNASTDQAEVNANGTLTTTGGACTFKFVRNNSQPTNNTHKQTQPTLATQISNKQARPTPSNSHSSPTGALLATHQPRVAFTCKTQGNSHAQKAARQHLLIKQTKRSGGIVTVKGTLNDQSSSKSHPRDYLGKPHCSSSNGQDNQRPRVSQSLTIRCASSSSHRCPDGHVDNRGERGARCLRRRASGVSLQSSWNGSWRSHGNPIGLGARVCRPIHAPRRN